MKHVQFYVSLADWFNDDPERRPLNALLEISTCLMQRGMESLEKNISDVLDGFLGVCADQASMKDGRASTRRTSMDNEAVYITCFKNDSTLVFVDIERLKTKDRRYLEFDVFATEEGEIQTFVESIIEDSMKCFGLTKSKTDLVKYSEEESKLLKQLRNSLAYNPPIDDALFRRLQEEKDRSMLRELKIRGSILERDMGELVPSGTSLDSIKNTLDFLSGEEIKLVEKKYAIVCKQTGDIILPLRNRDGFEKARELDCPKCSNLLGDEDVMAYYNVTDKLKGLIDGNKWMPLLVRDAFLISGVKSEDIYIEVKHDEDEIDVLVFYRRRIIAVEAKNRSVSLNDAYKLSAKRAKLEAVASSSLIDQRYDFEDDVMFSSIISEGSYSRMFSRQISAAESIIPVIISTHDISKDASGLLDRTTSESQFLENCDGKIESFVGGIIRKIDSDEVDRRLAKITSHHSGDSVANLAGEQLQLAFAKWRANHSD